MRFKVPPSILMESAECPQELPNIFHPLHFFLEAFKNAEDFLTPPVIFRP